ncbi:hypothetical protein C9374_010657 [Naegleria lovaniensis]|uniref:Uncharacterized protein n=1 Tax=Naegleria lovaniensis TaxID=51637 RepID=A0AA88GGV3_NAELO|nr:uncharacterized protein C9374_010657 [Naegleria lovaniensis]KAG2374638.1 hypothetical protein C9374_010657 [Naegleria lovaniensis]
MANHHIISSLSPKCQFLITLSISIFSLITTFFLFAQGILKWEEYPRTPVQFQRIADTHKKVVISVPSTGGLLTSEIGATSTRDDSSSLRMKSFEFLQPPLPFKYYYNETEYFHKYTSWRQVDEKLNLFQSSSISKSNIGKPHYDCSKKHFDPKLVKVFGPFPSSMEHVYFLRIESFDRFDLDSPYFQLFHARIVEKEHSDHNQVNIANSGDFDTSLAVSFTRFVPILETREFNEHSMQYVKDEEDNSRHPIFVDLKTLTSKKRNKRVYMGQFFLPRLKGGEFQVDVRMTHHCFSPRDYSSPSMDFSESHGIQIARIPFRIERTNWSNSNFQESPNHSHRYIMQEYFKFKQFLAHELFGTYELDMESTQDPYLKLSKKIFDEKIGFWMQSKSGECDQLVCRTNSIPYSNHEKKDFSTPQHDDPSKQVENSTPLLNQMVRSNQVYVPVASLFQSKGEEYFKNSQESSNSFTRPYEIFNPRQVMDCFHGKKVAFFGDSSLEEQFSHILEWMYQVDPSVKYKLSFPSEFNGKKLSKTKFRYSTLKHEHFEIQNRGLAHAYVDHNWGGIQSIMELDAARKEVQEIATTSDVIIMTFTFHEMAGHYGRGGFRNFDTAWIQHELFSHITKFFEWVSEWKKHSPHLKILWREVIPSHDPRVGPELIFSLTNSEIQRQIALRQDFIDYVPLEQTTWGNSFRGLFSDGLHYTEQDKMISKMNTQIVLNHMCRK